jgi:hypothetical protein
MIIPPAILRSLNDYQQWKSGKPDFDLLDYVGCIATPDLCYGFLGLLCPELIVHEGNYFLASHFDPTAYDKWMTRVGEPVAVQKAMNHIHVSTLFQGQDVPDELAKDVAVRIAECWSLVFASKGLVAEAFGDTLHDAQVTLFCGDLGARPESSAT